MRMRPSARWAVRLLGLLALVGAPIVVLTALPAAAAVTTETGLRTAFSDATVTQIDLGSNIDLSISDCDQLSRASANPLTIDGHGFAITQLCDGNSLNPQQTTRVMKNSGPGTLTLMNVTIQGGTARNDGMDVTNTDCLDPTGRDGGGVWSDADVTITNSVIQHNTADGFCSDSNSLTTDGGWGGGVFSSGNVTVTGSTFTQNMGEEEGGGIFAWGTVTITNSTFSLNSAHLDGGGVRADDTVTVSGSTFDRNSVTGNDEANGGGIATTGSVAVTNSTFTGNVAAHEGGGFIVADCFPTAECNLVAAQTRSVNITGSTFVGNFAAAEGGGFTVDSGDVDATIINSTFTQNTSEAGAAIDLSADDSRDGAGTLHLVYVTVARNTLLQPNEPFESPETASLEAVHLVTFGSVIVQPLGITSPNCDITGDVSSLGYNYSDDTSCGLIGTGDRQGAPDPNLLDIADNGGPTPTMLPATGSPLIDGVALASCQADGAAGVTTDQRGVTRPQGPGVTSVRSR